MTVKERGILVSGEMTRAILNGPKTQMRLPINKLLGYRSITEFQKSDTPGYDFTFRRPDMGWCDYRLDDLLKLCPYGKPGDRLWVRETWACLDSKAIPGARLAFRADTDGERVRVDAPWKSSIHMPRWASRILLEITEVRVERLQEISEEDAESEGIERLKSGRGYYDPTLPKAAVRLGQYYSSAKWAFVALWDSINYKKHPWESNPWVWVISFKRVEG